MAGLDSRNIQVTEIKQNIFGSSAKQYIVFHALELLLLLQTGGVQSAIDSSPLTPPLIIMNWPHLTTQVYASFYLITRSQ